jgi:hypothetical protein
MCTHGFATPKTFQYGNGGGLEICVLIMMLPKNIAGLKRRRQL